MHAFKKESGVCLGAGFFKDGNRLLFFYSPTNALKTRFSIFVFARGVFGKLFLAWEGPPPTQVQARVESVLSSPEHLFSLSRR
jgi:hypothetical protein